MNHSDLLVRPGHRIRLRDIDPKYTCDFEEKSDAREKLEADIDRLARLQEVFYAAQTHALLIVLQGLDCSGKDGAIKHVMSGINPQGVQVSGFKTPTEEELAHDFLWRCGKALPRRGQIAIFNRSYYEEVLVVRVHPELIDSERLPMRSKQCDVWSDRFEEINAFETHLFRSGTRIVKCFLHISEDEQRTRLLDRIDDPAKNWKVSLRDIAERKHWNQYQQAYEKMLNATSTELAPWYVIPSDHKWFMRTAIADIIIANLESLDVRYPSLDISQRGTLASIKAQLSRAQ